MLKSGKGSRPRKCKVCGDSFRPVYTSVQAVCGAFSCALVHGRGLQRKARTNDLRSHRDNDRSVWIKKTQAEFNKWIKLRDKGQPCISCGTTKDVQYCAGHFKTTGAHPELRFEPLNVHLQCNRYCNMGLSGNIAMYRPNLIARIGQDKVDWLEGPHEPKKYTIDDLKEIHAKYKKLNKGNV